MSKVIRCCCIPVRPLLNSLGNGVIDKLCEASIRYCNDFCDSIGEDLTDFIDENTPVVDLELNYDWEKEHGMQWIVRDDQVLYVGAYEGEDPWGDYTMKDEWNYA